MLSAIRFALLILLISFTNTVMAQDEHKLQWQKNKPLQWTDFKGAVDTSSKFHASTFCELFCNYKWTLKNNYYTFTFTTGSYLNTSKSWSVKAEQTPELLRHEQLHFDIAELFTRIYLKRLKSKVYTAAFEAEIEQINKDNLHNLKTVQDLYDEQTDHSKDKYMQAKWETYIAKLLDSETAIDTAIIRGPKK